MTDQVPKYNDKEFLDYDTALAKYGLVPKVVINRIGEFIRFVDLDQDTFGDYIIDHNDSIIYYKKGNYWWVETFFDTFSSANYKYRTIIDDQEYTYCISHSADSGYIPNDLEPLVYLLIKAGKLTWDDIISIAETSQGSKNARKV